MARSGSNTEVRSFQRRPVTLVEILVVTVILAVLSLGLTAVLMAPSKMWQRSDTLSELQSGLSLGLERIARELRSAAHASVTDTGSDATYDWVTKSGRIYLSGGKLVIERRAGPAEPLVNVYGGDDLENVSSVLFAPRSAHVMVALTLSKDGERVHGESAVALRNLDESKAVGTWAFNEGSGDVAFDSSCAGNNGALYGTQWTPGPDGAFALRFDATAPSYVEIPDTSALDVSQTTLYEFSVTGGSGTLYHRDTTRLFVADQQIGFSGGEGQEVRSDVLSWDASEWYRVVVVVDNTDAAPGNPGSVQFWRGDTWVGTAQYPYEHDCSGQTGKGYIGVRDDLTEPWSGDMDEAAIRRY